VKQKILPLNFYIKHLLTKKFLLILFVFASILCVDAKEFTVASYNVENLFDLQYNKTEYDEYHPNTFTWNRLVLEQKVQNISRVLKDIDADIVALQEIESQKALEYLLKALPNYRYHKFIKKQTSSVGVAVIAKYPIISTKKIDVDPLDLRSRDILRTTFEIDNKKFTVYNNHWRSKRAKESTRIVYALALLNDIKKFSKTRDYIIVGDLNSNYNEYLTFKYDESLNDTKGITGINQVLNTTMDENFVQKYNILNYTQNVHYNTWLELKTTDRFSSKYRGQNNTPDNILLAKQLFDDKNIWYVDKSFHVFKPHYLYKNFSPVRWDIYKKKGFSDHLPIIATFSTEAQTFHFKSEKHLSTIDTLYELQQVNNFHLKDMVVIYKRGNIVIIKHHDQKVSSKAITIFYPSDELILGGIYDLTVEELDNYNGLKEIKKTSHIEKIGEIYNFKEYYLDGLEIDLFDKKYQNNIVTNLEGIYKKGYLNYYKNGKFQKIRVYFKKGIKRPKDGRNITIHSGHLGIYKDKVQIVLYSNKDFN
jgi:exonuclease III